MIGFTAGIAAFITTRRLAPLSGLSLAGPEPGALLDKPPVLLAARETLNPRALSLAARAIGVLVELKKSRPHWPGMPIAVALTAAATALFGLPVETIGTRFGGLSSGLPAPGLPEITAARALAVLPEGDVSRASAARGAARGSRMNAVDTPALRPDPPARTLCTDCGVSRMADPARCGRACQFIAPDYAGLEARIHGRARDPDRPDELHFGPFLRMVRARLRDPLPGAQWTGIATTLGARLLETGRVDAILTVGPDPADRWRPVPILVTAPEGMARARGMRMGYAPVLALLEEAAARGFRRLGVIGIPCQVYALRALEAELGLEALHVIGTPCSDNTTTESFHRFLALLDDRPETITYLEFRADFRVELRYADGRQRLIPFLKLPISKLPPDFFPLTCRTCVDYANALADIVVGYMGGEGRQWLIVRNARGQEMLDLLGDAVEIEAPGSRGKRRGAVAGFAANVARAAGGLPLRAMPDWLRPLMAWLQPRIGPRGLEFARARVEMKAIESVLHLRRAEPRRMKFMIPPHVWALAAPYGLRAATGEAPAPRPARTSAEAASIARGDSAG